MKFVRSNKDQWVFRLGRREKSQLVKLLKLYPRVPPGHHTRNAESPGHQESERLLNEALAEHRESNRKLVQAFVADKQRFAPDDHGLLLTLSPAEYEWLLQVLNDVRVGSWLCLGSPEERMPLMIVNEKNAADLWAMELCVYFQASLLREREQAPRKNEDGP